MNGSLIILDKTVIEIGIELLDCWQSFGLKHITVDGAVDILGSSALPIFKLRKQFINKDWSFLRDETMSLDSSPKHHSWRKLVFFISQFVTNLVFFTAIDNIVLGIMTRMSPYYGAKIRVNKLCPISRLN